MVVEGGGAATLPASLLQPIRRAKYPALSTEEEAISLPLQTLCQARGSEHAYSLSSHHRVPLPLGPEPYTPS